MVFEQVLGRSSAQGSPQAVLAPMSGISDVAFRRLASRFGAGFVVTEMVAADACIRGAEEARLRSEGRGVSPHVVQLVGRDPGPMAEAARLVEGAGADVVDINMGCPAKRVVGGLAGSALMREPTLALSIVAGVVAAVRLPVTVKMRLGWDTSSCNASVMAREVGELGAQGVTVHGRTRQQFYAGASDWRAISDVVAATSLLVIANGDVVSTSTARACLTASGAAGVMVGRAAIGQPWIVGEIASALDGIVRLAPDLEARAAAACEHYDTVLTLYGRSIGVKHARKHLAAYAERAGEAGYGLSASDRSELVTSLEPSRVLALLGRIYDEPLRCAA